MARNLRKPGVETAGSQKGTALVPYLTDADLLMRGLFFQLWLRLATRAKRAMRRRKCYIVKNWKVL